MTHPSTLKQYLLHATQRDVFVAAGALMRTPEGRSTVSNVLHALKNAYDNWHGLPRDSQYTHRPDLCQPVPPAAPPLLPYVVALVAGSDLAVYAHNSSLWVRIPDFRDLQPEARVAPLHAGVAAAIAGCLGARMAQEFGHYLHVADLRKQKKWIVKDPQTGLRHTFLKEEHAHKRATEYQVKLAHDLPFAQITIPVEEVLE